MKLYIKWRYPDETEIHEHIFYDIVPEKTNINNGMLYFAEGDEQNKHWLYQLDHIVEMKFIKDTRTFEVGFDCGDGIFSVNMVEGDETTSEEYARKHAQKHGYKLSYIVPVSEESKKEKLSKGMPLIKL